MLNPNWWDSFTRPTLRQTRKEANEHSRLPRSIIPLWRQSSLPGSEFENRDGGCRIRLSAVEKALAWGFRRYDFVMDEQTLAVRPIKQPAGKGFGVADPPRGQRRYIVVVPTGEYQFDGTISRQDLENFLARSISVEGVFNGRGDLDDNLRMLKSLGVKYAGRSLCLWGAENHFLANLERARKQTPKALAADPEMVLEACVFETVGPRVEQIAVPDWVFAAFGQPVVKGTSFTNDIIYPVGQRRAMGNAQVSRCQPARNTDVVLLSGGVVHRRRFRGHPLRTSGDYEPQRPRQCPVGPSARHGPGLCGQARPPAHGPLQWPYTQRRPAA